MLGNGISDGVGIGYAKTIENVQTTYTVVDIGTPDEEKSRLSGGIEKLLLKIKSGNNLSLNKEQNDILLGHMFFLKDPAVIQKLNEEIDNGRCAEAAVEVVFKSYSEMFISFEDSCMAQKSVDMLDISTRLICELQDRKYYDLSNLSENSILVVKEITPSMLISLGNKKIEGIVVEKCGEYSHSVIIAKALEIPMVINVRGFDEIIDGQPLIIDGGKGKIIQNPTEEQINEYWKIKKQIYIENSKLKEYVDKKATYDGKNIRFMANVSSEIDIKNAGLLNINGVGICRTECLFMGCGHIPTEAEQYDMYVKVASAVKGKDISIRVFDIGGDKEIDWLDCDSIVSNDRGIRYCLNHIDIFKNQLRAILRVSGIYSNIKILLPFVSSIEEIYETKAIIKELTKELLTKGFSVNENIEIGAMIETPATVFIMDLLAKEVDFFSVGTNDLIHSLLVSDRYSGYHIYILFIYQVCRIYILHFLSSIIYLQKEKENLFLQRWPVMIKNNIKFTTTSQFIIFHNICSKVSSDVQIRDISNHNKPVDGKKLSELANIQLGLPALLMIHGNDEVQVFSSLQKYGICHKKEKK